MYGEKKLQELFNFGNDELYSNRNGILTPRQETFLKEQIKGKNLGTFLVTLSATLLFVLFGSFLVFSFHANSPKIREESLFSLVIPVGIFIGIFIFIFMVKWILHSDMRNRKISNATGLMNKVSREIQTQYGQKVTQYFIKIDRINFQLDSAEKFNSVTEGRNYSVYYIKYFPYNIILSLEMV